MENKSQLSLLKFLNFQVKIRVKKNYSTNPLTPCKDPYHLHNDHTASFDPLIPPFQGLKVSSLGQHREGHPTTTGFFLGQFGIVEKIRGYRFLAAFYLIPSWISSFFSFTRVLIKKSFFIYIRLGNFCKVIFLKKKLWYPSVLFSLKKAFIGIVLFIFTFTACQKTKEPIAPILQMFDGLSVQFSYHLSEPGNPSASKQVIDQFLLTLNLAKNKVNCVFYDIDNPTILKKLQELHNQGIQVRVAMDEDNRTYLGYKFLNEFLPSFGRDRKLWIGNRGAGEVYMNFCVVDDRRAAFSTAPFTMIGLNSSPMMYGMLQSYEDGIVRKFAAASDLILNGSFGSSKQRLNQRNHWIVGDTDVGIYLAPEENPVRFISQRIPNATQSIQIFTTEFFSNRRVTATQERTIEDVAFEIIQSPVNIKQVIGSWKNDLELDPNAVGDCSFNNYLGLDCNPVLNSGATGLAPRRVNSLHYLRMNGLEPRIYADNKPSNSLNITILDAGQPNGMVFISSHPYSSRGDSSHDGYMFVFEDRQNVVRVQNFYNALLQKTKDTNALDGDNDSGFMDIVISEINWMGGGNSVGSDTSSEWVEFYNRTNRPINVSNWSFQCGSNNSFSNVFRFPPRTIIGSKQYFVVQHRQEPMVREAHLTIDWGGRNQINDSRTDQCRIVDNIGRVIDVAGNSGTPFISRMDLFGKIDVERGHYRTMERTNLNLPGENITNWHTNPQTNPIENFNWDPDYHEKTFGTPGYANSLPGELPPDLENPFRSLVINEYSRNTSPNDVFVEIYNPLDIDLNFTGKNIYYLRSNNCGITTQNFQDTLLLTGTIPAKGYYVISRSASSNAGIANLLGMGANLATNHCILLAIGTNISGLNHPGLIDFVNLGNNATSLIGGSFSSFVRGQRCPDGNKSSVLNNSTDFVDATVSTPGAPNQCN